MGFLWFVICLSEIHAKLLFYQLKNLKKLFNLEFQLLILLKNLTILKEKQNCSITKSNKI